MHLLTTPGRLVQRLRHLPSYCQTRLRHLASKFRGHHAESGRPQKPAFHLRRLSLQRKWLLKPQRRTQSPAPRSILHPGHQDPNPSLASPMTGLRCLSPRKGGGFRTGSRRGSSVCIIPFWSNKCFTLEGLKLTKDNPKQARRRGRTRKGPSETLEISSTQQAPTRFPRQVTFPRTTRSPDSPGARFP